MDRLFYIRRRRPHIVDLVTPVHVTPGSIHEYRLKFALNFDQVFATFLTSSNVGHIDSSINRNVVDTQPTTGTSVRIVFDPSTYAINDNNPFWLQYVLVTDGVEGTPGAPTLVVPDAIHYGTGVIVIRGDAPAAAPLQIDLPRKMTNFQITNEDGANNLLVGAEDGGPMTAVLPLVGTQAFNYGAAQGSLYVQGDGGDVTFSAAFTMAFPG